MVEVRPVVQTDYYRKADSEVINSDEYAFVASGIEAAFLDVTVDGVLRNDGKIICSSLTVNNVLINNNIIEINW